MTAKVLLSNLPARAALALAHLIYSLLEYLLWLVRWIQRKVSAYHRDVRPPVQRSGGPASKQLLATENDFIEYGVRDLKKIPSHLVVMLGMEEPNYWQLARFVTWALAAGIGHVSFYDHRGLLKRNHHQILQHINQQNRSDGDQIVWTAQLKTDGVVPPRNGYRRRLVVSFFSPEDGRVQLVRTAQTIGGELGSGSIAASSDITVEHLDRKLQDHFWRVPDPELALYYGAVCSTYGMLPWQIRLTEFMRLNAPSLAETGPGHVLECLFRYAKCEQRFGK